MADSFSNIFKLRSWEKWSKWQHTVLFGAVNNESVAGLLGLVSAHLPWPHSLQSVHSICHCCVVQFCNANTLQQLQSLQSLTTSSYGSEGSVVICLKCGGIFNDHFIASLLDSIPAKEYWNSVNIWQRYGQEYGVSLFNSWCSLQLQHEQICWPHAMNAHSTYSNNTQVISIWLATDLSIW